MSHRVAASVLLVVLAISSLAGFGGVKAQPETLANTINNVVGHVETTDTPWAVTYSQIFGLKNASVFDSAIQTALIQNDYQNVVFVARLAELNGYSSQTISDSFSCSIRKNAYVWWVTNGFR